MNATPPKPPTLLKTLAILLFLISLFAFFGSLFLWGEGFFFAFPPGVDYTYPVADLLVNAPASLLAAVGLWRLRRYGFAAALFVAGFYLYASVEIFVHVIQDGRPYPLEIVLPQILAVAVALALLFYLWRQQDLFFLSGDSRQNRSALRQASAPELTATESLSTE
jgi:hypothetical protein